MNVLPLDIESTPVAASLAQHPVRRALTSILGWSAGLLLALNCLVVLYGVVTRYIVGDQAYWTEEAARLLMVWLTAFGGAYALCLGMHIRIDLLIRTFSTSWRSRCEALGASLTFLFLGAAAWRSWQLIELRRGDTSPALELPYSLFVWPLLVSLAVMALLELERLFDRKPGESAAGAGAGIVLALGGALAAGWLEGVSQGLPLLWILGAAFVALLILGVPVAFSLGLASLLFFDMRPAMPQAVLPQRMVGGIDSFALLAVPLFLVAGVLMEVGSISRKLIEFATALVGHIRGGLGMVTVTAEILFSGVSGSTTADVAAVGGAMNKGMVKAGYKPEDVASIVSAACAMGILIPPSLHMVLLGSIVSVSVSALFWGGILPSLALALGLYVTIYWKARSAGWPAETSRASFTVLMRAARGALLPLILPVIIFAGIRSGLATVTESAVLAVAYALLLSIVVYRELSPKEIAKAFIQAAGATGMTLWLVMTATIFGWIMTGEQVPNLLGQALAGMTSSPAIFLMLVIVVMVIFSGLLEGIPALLIFAPIFYPIATQYGIDGVHFGLILIASLGIGFFLPPIGLGLFLACGIAGADLAKTSRAFLPYMLVLMGMLAIVSLFPEVSLLLPRLMKG